MYRYVVCLFLTAMLVGCASPPRQHIAAPVLTPDADEELSLDQLVLLVDASSSLPENSLYRDQKTLLDSVIGSIPDGSYETATINFGGFAREGSSLAAVSRAELASDADSFTHLAEGTPIHKALAEAGAELEGRSGRAAVVLFSDGALTDEVGRDVDAQLVLDAAAEAAAGYDGELCIHAVQTGDEEDGAVLLQELTRVTDCGTFRSANRIDSVVALHQFERDVFFVPSLPDVAAAPPDRDVDGVVDDEDHCPDTPRGARVDPRGCWAVDLHFAFDSATIEGKGVDALAEVAEVLNAHPDLRVRVDGHTDWIGADAYNQKLSERRAAAARDYLVDSGIAAGRLDSHGFGETQPAASNETDEGRALNRRTELTVLQD